VPIEPWWETNPATTPRQELGMVSPELPAVPPGEQPRPLEGQLRHRHPVAVVGVVENGLVRLLDPRVRLPEQSRVIVVAADPPEPTSECAYRPPGTVPLGTLPLPPNDPRGSRLVPYYGLLAYLCQIAERISSHPFDPLLACLSRCPLFTATTLAT